MRILWLTPGFAADENDLNCLPPLQLLARELLQQGVDLQIVALEYPFRSEPYRWQASPGPSKAGEAAAVFPCNGQNRRWLKPRTLWRAMRFCDKISDAAPPPLPPPKGDIRFASLRVAEGNGNVPLWRGEGGRSGIRAIHSFWLGWASGIGEKISRRHGVPHFTTLMGQDVLPNRYVPLWRGVGGRKNERASRLVAVSDFQNEIFEKNTGLRASHVIPWGVNEGEIPAFLPAERRLDVLGVGSLVAVKNWGKWLKVMALAVQKHPSLRAELIGDGPERGKLEQLARELGLEREVRFVGNLPRPEVLARMRQAKALLHTARFESFGYVLAEAALSGCRVVGTPVGATSGFGKTAETEEDLAALLLDALGQEIRAQAFVPFGMKETAAAYLRLWGF